MKEWKKETKSSVKDVDDRKVMMLIYNLHFRCTQEIVTEKYLLIFVAKRVTIYIYNLLKVGKKSLYKST